MGRLLRADLAVVALLIASIFLMVVPLPTFVVDALLATNISLGVLLLMVAFYLRAAVQFSTLPTVILIVTIFRLSLSVAVTRLVLTQADAGEVIQTFGDFVVGGNVVVGLIIFLIITVVQFVVITKGAERVSEVAARFSLDGLPGKQMAIDADVRSGNLDQAGAQERRKELEKESSLFGAMDGAMKFVKGDAIAGLVIIAINLIGGFAVGVLQVGLSASKAATTYSILTIGDGLVAQIPALLISVAAGTVVTRVAGSTGDSLGGDIAAQLSFDGRALWLASIIVAALALIPGLPASFFLVLAGGLALLARKATRTVPAVCAGEQSPAAVKDIPPAPGRTGRVGLLLSPALATAGDHEALLVALQARCSKLSKSIGIAVPMPYLEIAEELNGRRFRLEIDSVAIQDVTFPATGIRLLDDPKNATLAGVAVTRGDPLPGVPAPVWVADEATPLLSQLGVGCMMVQDVVVDATAHLLRRHASLLFGIQETGALLATLESELPDLVKETLKVASLNRIADVARRLLDEGIPLKNHRGLLEALAEHAGREPDNAKLAERVRLGLRREICNLHADQFRFIAAFLIDPEAEKALRETLQTERPEKPASIPATVASALAERIRIELAQSRRQPAVMITAPDLRRPLRALLVNHGVDAAVLSLADLLPDYTVQPIGMIKADKTSVRAPMLRGSSGPTLARSVAASALSAPA